MTDTVVDGAIIVGAIVLMLAFVGGLFVGARLARPAPGQRPPAGGALVELLQLLREALNVVRELRNTETGEAGKQAQPSGRRKWFTRR